MQDCKKVRTSSFRIFHIKCLLKVRAVMKWRQRADGLVCAMMQSHSGKNSEYSGIQTALSLKFWSLSSCFRSTRRCCALDCSSEPIFSDLGQLKSAAEFKERDGIFTRIQTVHMAVQPVGMSPNTLSVPLVRKQM